MYDNKLLYGKNSLERIVSVEPVDDKCIIYTEDNDGVHETIVPHKYWRLASQKPHSSWVKLGGGLTYQYGKQYSAYQSYSEEKYNLKRFDTFEIYNHKEAFLVKDGYTYFKGMNIGDVSILSFDIETTSLRYTENDTIILISNTYRKGDKVVKKLFSYDEYSNQGEMLEHWCQWVREVNPSIILGYNILSFDLPYIRDCAEFHAVTLDLGRDGSPLRFASRDSKFRKDQTQDLHYRRVSCFGREIIDGLFLSIKHDTVYKKYNNYRLKDIIKVEKLEKADRTFYNADRIRYNFKDPVEFDKIKKYCSDDSDDALALFDLMAPPYFFFCQMVPMPFQRLMESATGSQLNSIFIRSYLQDKHSIPKADEIASFEGAISRGVPGIHRNVLAFDVASLYPSVMLQYEIYPKHKDPNKHLITILRDVTNERLKNKKLGKETGNKFYKNLEQAQKIAINSIYGLLGAPGLNFNFAEGAAKVTEHGREILKKAITWATSKSYHDWMVENGLAEEEPLLVEDYE